MQPGLCWLPLPQDMPCAPVQLTAHYQLKAPLSSGCPITGTLSSPGHCLALADFHGVPVSPFLQVPLALPQGVLSCVVADCYCEESHGNIIVHISVPRLTLQINFKGKTL